MNTLPVPTETVEHAIEKLAADATIEQIAEAHQRLAYYIGYGQALKRKFEEAAIAWIKEHGPIRYALNAEGGEMILSLSHPKDTKCVDVPATVQALIEHSGGDWQAVETCLSSSAVKHGAAKKVLPPEVWAKCFKVVVRDKLDDGTPAPKELIQFDSRFVK